MATRESKPTTQTTVEFNLYRGKQCVFSHPVEAAVRGMYARSVADDAVNGRSGRDASYKLTQRTIVYDSAPGEEKLGGKVTEKELPL